MAAIGIPLALIEVSPSVGEPKNPCRLVSSPLPLVVFERPLICSLRQLQLDVYVWLAQRLHRVPTGKPQFIPWTALHEQIGQGYDRIRDFRRRFLQTLHHVESAYPGARLSADDGGLTLTHSSPPVASRSGTAKLL
jgi:hypothetical protein